MPIVKRFIHAQGEVLMEPIVRTKQELFSKTILDANAARTLTAAINTNFYKLTYACGIRATAGKYACPADSTTPNGYVVSNKKVVAGESAPLDFYIAFYKEKERLTQKFATGQGDAPSDAYCAFGGLGPIIINGLPYGVMNKYRSGAPTNAAVIGPPAPDAQPFLIQRSSKKYTSFVNNNTGSQGRLGKTCVGISDKEIFLYVQEHGQTGMGLDEIRDEFLRNDCKHAVFFDGSDSSLLFSGGQFLVNQGEDKDETCTVGAAFYWKPNAVPQGKLTK